MRNFNKKHHLVQITQFFSKIAVTLALLLAFTPALAGLTYAQQTKLNIDLSNVSMATVINFINKNSDFSFVYKDKDIAEMRSVTVKMKDATVQQILSHCLKGSDCSFKIEDKTIILTKIEAKQQQQQQQPPPQQKVNNTISGVVESTSGERLPGVTVMVKGSSVGTVTNENGEYTLVVPRTGDVVLVSLLGFEPKEIVFNQTNTNLFSFLRLTPVTNKMDDVIVVGYGTTKRKDLTGSVVRVETKALEQSSFTDVGKILQGQVAGMEVLQGLGRPGDRVRIRIRGESTLQGDASPLIVIDDIPMPEDYDINMINPNDIQSIDILKGASAAAIYGSKGSAGVILITTKQGKNGTPEVFYSGSVFIKDFETPIETLSGEQFRNLMHESVLTNFKYAQMRDPEANWDIRAHSDYNTVIKPGYMLDGNTDWMDLLTRQPVSQNHTLGIRGGNKTASYYTSIGYTDDIGRIIGNDASRISITSNLDIRATSFLELGVRLNGSKQKIRTSLEPNGWDDGSGLSMAAAARPDIPAFDEKGDYYRYWSPGHTRYLNNPLQLAEQAPKNTKKDFYNVSGYLRILFTKDLRFQTTYAYTESKDESDLYWGSYTYNGSGGFYNDAKGLLDISRGYSTQSNFDNSLNYTKTLQNHDISAMVGTTFNQEKAGSLNQTYKDFPDDYIQNTIYSSAKLISNTGNDDMSAYFSIYGRVNYKFMERYMITATLRSDASSKFSPKYRVGIFPSVAAGWIISDEKFIKDNKIGLSFLKLRAGWGVTGDNRIGRYTWRTRFTSADYFDKPGTRPMSVGNDEVKWEQTEQTDIGLDYGFWNNRIRGTLGVYTKNTKGLLFAYSMAPSAGITEITTNMAKIHNKGIEFDINAQVVETQDWGLNLMFNISSNASKVLNLDKDMTSSATGGTEIGTTVLKEGEPLGLFYGLKSLGIVKDQAMSDRLFEQYGVRYNIGKFAYEGDPSYNWNGTPDPRMVLGKTVPDFYGGFSVDMRYKRLTLRAQGKFSYGAMKHWSAMSDQFHANPSNPSNRLIYALNRWTPDNPDAYGQRFGSGWESEISSNYLFDASFFKLTDITLSYDLPERWLKGWRVSNFNIYAAVNNVFTLTSYPGTNVESFSFDPIVGAAHDYSVYPLERTYTFGLKIMFR